MSGEAARFTESGPTGNNVSRKLFVVGVGRSGTSLLQAMLASHPDIGCLPETSFFRRFVCGDELPTGNEQDTKRILNSDQRISRLGFDFEAVDFSTLDPRWPAKDLYERFFSQFRDSAFVVDKDPRSIELIEPMLKLWPSSRVIHIFRDPRDVLASKKKAAWSSNRSIFFHLVAGAAQFRLARRATRKFGESAIFTVRYESLLSEPESSLAQICNWLGIEFDSRMLDFGNAAANLTSAEEMQWKKQTLGPLIQSNQDKWKSELSNSQAIAAEVACMDVMREGNYVPSANQTRISLLDRICGATLGRSARLAARVYCWKRELETRQLIRRFVA